MAKVQKSVSKPKSLSLFLYIYICSTKKTKKQKTKFLILYFAFYVTTIILFRSQKDGTRNVPLPRINVKSQS